jgi:cyclopropane fatty-acyl-phospholipid synthase-like methyltransferase
VSERLKAVIDDLPITPGTRLLEIGCGHGVAATYAIARGAVYTGIDRSAKMIAAARKRNPGAELIHADLETVDLGDRRFDIVLGVWVRTLRERPALGGRWLVTGGILRIV